MIHLETPRLLLRTARPSDVSRIVAYVRRNKEHLGRFTPQRKENYFTEPFWREQIRNQRRQLDAGIAARFHLFDRNEPEEIIGDAALFGVERGPFQSCYLGYAIDAKKQGMGLMHEAVSEVIRFAFEDWNLHRISAGHMPRNKRSGDVLKKLKFRKDGLAKSYLQIAGKWEDHLLYSLINKNWAPRVEQTR